MAVTYRLCSIFSASLTTPRKEMDRKIETFEELVKLIDSNFMRERGVAFYADRPVLSHPEVSFGDPKASSFGTFFKKHTRLSPKNYRMGAE